MKGSRPLVGALLLFAAGCADGSGSDVRIREFSLERADPPADHRGGMLLVSPRSDLHFAWRIDGEPARLALTANEVEVASFSGSIPAGASDLCSEARCATSHIGEIVYRLEAWDDGGRSDARTLAVHVADQGLQILSFTSAAASVEPGSDVTLAWQSSGATRARLEATPIGGGETRALGEFAGAEARDGSFVDRGLADSTLYRLTIADDHGREATAETSVSLIGEAWITALSAEPPRAAPGETVVLSWQSVGLERLTIVRDDGGPGITDVTGAELTAGSREVTVERTATFTFVGVSRDGILVTDRCDDTGCAPAKITVEVVDGPAVVSFTADPPEIPSGGLATLRWEVSDADEVMISWADATGTGTLDLGDADGSIVVDPPDSTRYTLIASAGGKNASRQVQVGVRPHVELDGPRRVAPGESFDVSWRTRGATRLELFVDGRPLTLGDAPIESGSRNLRAASDAVPGSTIEVRLVASDDETPRRRGEAQHSIEVGM